MQDDCNNYVEVKGSPSVLAKLVMPRSFVKCKLYDCSELFKHLAHGNTRVVYTEVSARTKSTSITILNESINKIPYKIFKDDYLLISNNIIDSKYSLYMSASALITKK